MLFSTPTFLFIFLPVVLTVYWLLPERISLRNAFLLAASILFYAWGEGAYVLLLGVSIGFNYAFGLLIDSTRTSRRGRWFLAGAIAANVAVLCVYKYSTHAIAALNWLFAGFGTPIASSILPLRLPIGLSFYTFHGLSYLIDVHRGRARAQRNPITLGLYFALFPQLILGPIIRYRQIERSLKARASTLEGATQGIGRFIVGLAKKVLIADILADPVNRLFTLPPAQMTTSLAWLAIVAFTLQIYFDFSSYSDMAIGLARIFGFPFPENFTYPYAARSRTEMFQRFHISFFAWMRDYVYRPLVPKGSSTLRENAAVMVVFTLAGLWHGATATFLMWGVLNGVFIVVERIWLGKYLTRWWMPWRHAYVLAVTILMTPFFRGTTIGQSVQMIAAMAGFGEAVPGALPLAFYLTTPVLLALSAGIVGSAPTVPWLGRKIAIVWNVESPLRTWGMSLLLSCAFLLSMLAIASRTHAPFIYFKF